MREMQIKSTMRYHSEPIMMAIIKNKKQNRKITSVDEDLETLEPLCVVGENTKWHSCCGILKN